MDFHLDVGHRCGQGCSKTVFLNESTPFFRCPRFIAASGTGPLFLEDNSTSPPTKHPVDKSATAPLDCMRSTKQWCDQHPLTNQTLGCGVCKHSASTKVEVPASYLQGLPTGAPFNCSMLPSACALGATTEGTCEWSC